jgi:NADPH2:quinone reductase
MGHDQACALLCAYGTSHYALKQRANLKKGDTLVVLGASGSTGIAAIQIGKIMGAKVIAASSSIEKQNYTKSLGADITIGYENIKDQLKELTNNKGVDVIFDPVGGELFEESSRALSRYGKILVIGFASGKIPKFPINLALVKEFDIVGVFWGAFTRNNTNAFKENMNQLFNWFKDGKINPQIEEKFKLQDASKALDKILNRGTKGKVILYP